MEKKLTRISDTIPEMPASFDQVTERALRSVCEEHKSNIEYLPFHLNRKAWIAIIAAAVLLVATTAFAIGISAMIAARNRSSEAITGW